MKLLSLALVALTVMLPTAAPIRALELGDEEIAAVQGGTVSLVAYDGATGKTLANLKVHIAPLGMPDPVWQGLTDRSGAFAQNLPAGRYRVTVFRGDTSVQKDFTIAAGQSKAFRIQIPVRPNVDAVKRGADRAR